MDLEGAIALVTGGAKGLGLAIANNLYESGAKILIADRDIKALVDLPEGMEGYALDVTQPIEVKKVIQEIIKRHGRIDILVNNAGVIFSKPMVNIMNSPEIMHDYESFRKCITANLDSVFIMTSAVIEQMVLGRIKGVIVNVSSISAFGNEGQIAYSAAKAGVNAMTVTLSKELGRLGIRCNAVAPGFIETDSTRQALNESIIKHIQSNTPLRKLGQAKDVAQAVASVITNDFMSGVVLDVNGGLTI
ncbi:SDR family NAD(P)-dependent oxidoreductase [Legionella fallonii]|uniref:3-ketoacyl-(Acyl-carrier-protein) reductase n=1 Tax=Legionella fallonii LLAP-10 TaxID=1212491 RepID=A0A098G8N7_9GAMM|nr:SDR family NAD(P)-dependent oxidoreductase [Legionella fallonii]CEG58354.1 3-ketoacyl-(Acyl-carrier-protein) reductase [Legionella fallonii LLAP-10]